MERIESDTRRQYVAPGWLRPSAMQWVLFAVFAVLYIVSWTPSRIGRFLREFSAFIFP